MLQMKGNGRSQSSQMTVLLCKFTFYNNRIICRREKNRIGESKSVSSDKLRLDKWILDAGNWLNSLISYWNYSNDCPTFCPHIFPHTTIGHIGHCTENYWFIWGALYIFRCPNFPDHSRIRTIRSCWCHDIVWMSCTGCGFPLVFSTVLFFTLAD